MKELSAYSSEALAFLVVRFGFQITSEALNEVVYSRADAAIHVSYDRQRSYELTLSLQIEGNQEPPYEFREMLRACEAPEDLPTAFQVTDPSEISEFLQKLADSLERHCGSLLAGDAGSYRRLRALRAR